MVRQPGPGLLVLCASDKNTRFIGAHTHTDTASSESDSFAAGSSDIIPRTGNSEVDDWVLNVDNDALVGPSPIGQVKEFPSSQTNPGTRRILQTTECTGCYSGTSGPCKQDNAVCHAYSSGTTCPTGTTACNSGCIRRAGHVHYCDLRSASPDYICTNNSLPNSPDYICTNNSLPNSGVSPCLDAVAYHPAWMRWRLSGCGGVAPCLDAVAYHPAWMRWRSTLPGCGVSVGLPGFTKFVGIGCLDGDCDTSFTGSHGDCAQQCVAANAFKISQTNEAGLATCCCYTTCACYTPQPAYTMYVRSEFTGSGIPECASTPTLAPTSAPTAPTSYAIVTSGASCSATRSDCDTIHYQEDCISAAQAMLLSDQTTGGSVNDANLPAGCSLTLGSSAVLKHNDLFTSSTACSARKQCVCKCSGTVASRGTWQAISTSLACETNTPTYYDLVTSGASCSAARSDCEAIFYKEECKRAAIELQLSDTDTGGAQDSHSYGMRRHVPVAAGDVRALLQMRLALFAVLRCANKLCDCDEWGKLQCDEE
ncbi:hypothetical protein CYMTET_30698 [Cymbomonas tetramitiformis]|uniref:Uncharacterized protein n=1 Tax=Cymbomonas tetramitiformis TaxID=36881 RepID=A0AAE0FIS7_9CHLO|nr:hypothetical protein CYMTET_30698 [Cymbomonas tetramitiformis]